MKNIQYKIEKYTHKRNLENKKIYSDKINFYKKLLQKGGVYCSLCLEKSQDGENWVKLNNCSHLFHQDCISDLIERRMFKCPNCRNQMKDPPYFPVTIPSSKTSQEEISELDNEETMLKEDKTPEKLEQRARDLYVDDEEKQRQQLMRMEMRERNERQQVRYEMERTDSIGNYFFDFMAEVNERYTDTPNEDLL